MKILIDVGHPADFLLFRNFAKKIIEREHDILFTYRKKEYLEILLKQNNYNSKCFGKKFNSKIGKLFGLLKFDVQELSAGLKFKPDLFLSHGSMYAAHASAILDKPHIALEDTFNKEQTRLYLPFTEVVLTGEYDHPDLGKNEIRYNVYHELAYLHPNYFRPDKTVLEELGVEENEKYVIIRFVSWQATHDAGHKGISFENKLKAVKEFEKYAKVFISSESELPKELEAYRIKIEPHRMHDALAFAQFIIGESFTMLSEAAILGTPAILNHDTKCYYLQEQQQKYGLVFNYTESEKDQLKAIEKGVDLLNTPNLKEQWQDKRKKMLADKIDVTAFMVWFVENYPESVRVMKENPEYQERFK